MTTDASVNKLIINTLTREQYDNIPDKSETELYMVTDDTTYIEASDLKTINNQSLLGGGNITIPIVEAYTAEEIETLWENI